MCVSVPVTTTIKLLIIKRMLMFYLNEGRPIFYRLRLESVSDRAV